MEILSRNPAPLACPRSDRSGRRPAGKRDRLGINSEAAQRAAPERLLVWAEAFDEWLRELGAKYTKSTTKQAKLAWRRLLQNQGSYPWALAEEDIQAHAAWMEEQGYAASTTANALGYIAKFYEWCDERRIDPEVVPPGGGSKSRNKCGTGSFDVKSKSKPFNPAAGVKRPKVERYAGAALLSEGEVERLLEVLRRDESALGKRDYAFILARARLGVPLRAIQRLRWGQVRGETLEGGYFVGLDQSRIRGQASFDYAQDAVQVRWSSRDETGTGCSGIPRINWGQICGINSGRGWSRFPDEVWAGMLDYLSASGRLAGMAAEDYIFAPLAEPGTGKDNDKAEDWLGGQYVSYSAIRASLKLYGRLVEIPEERLTMKALRRTATRRELEAGRSTAEMQIFLDSREEERFAKYRLGKLPGRAEEDMGTEDVSLVEIPDRKAKPFRPGEGVVHGYYQKSQPAEAVLAVLAEEIEGVEEQIAGLRLLVRGLMERLIAAQGSQLVAQLADAHSRAATRLAELIDFERNREQKGEDDSGTEELLEAMDQMAIALGRAPYSEDIRARFVGEDADLGLTNRRLVEEIAAVRYSLRRVLALSLESEGTAAYLHLVEIYGNGCLRLVRLLKREGRDDGRLGDYLQEMLLTAVSEVLGDWQAGEEGQPLIWDR